MTSREQRIRETKAPRTRSRRNGKDVSRRMERG